MADVVESLRELETLVTEYDPKNSDWYFRRTVIAEIIGTIRALSQAGAGGGVVEAARAAVERLASVQMNISLEEWSKLSSAILAALAPSPSAGALEDVMRDVLAGGTGMTITRVDPASFAPPAPPVPTASVEAVIEIIDTHEAAARERADKMTEMDLPATDPGLASAFAVRDKLIEIGVEIWALAARSYQPAPSPAGGVREALARLEEACDQLAATRSQATYLAMIDNDKASDALIELDVARMQARAALSSPATPEPETASCARYDEEPRVEALERDVPVVWRRVTDKLEYALDIDTRKIIGARIFLPTPEPVSAPAGEVVEVVPVAASEGRLQAALDYLAENKSRSLAFDGKTFCEDDNSDLWIVTEVQGGMNDREWVLIGSGGTPAEALMDALPARPAGEKEGRS